jgi:hypothetical protein
VELTRGVEEVVATERVDALAGKLDTPSAHRQGHMIVEERVSGASLLLRDASAVMVSLLPERRRTRTYFP